MKTIGNNKNIHRIIIVVKGISAKSLKNPLGTFIKSFIGRLHRFMIVIVGVFILLLGRWG